MRQTLVRQHAIDERIVLTLLLDVGFEGNGSIFHSKHWDADIGIVKSVEIIMSNVTSRVREVFVELTLNSGFTVSAGDDFERL